MKHDSYTHGHQPSVLRSHQWRTAENSAGYLLPHLTDSMTVLDVGCGPGTISCDLAARTAHVIGIEPKQPILDTAATNAAERGVDNVEFRLGSVYELDFADDTFDIVHAHQVLQHLENPVAALQEMIRVTTPGGVVAVRDADYAAMSWHPEPPELDRWRDIYDAVARRNGGEPNAGRHLLSWALAAGCEREAITASIDTWLFCDDADRTWWGDMWAERTVESDFGAQARDHGDSTLEEQEALAAAWRTWMQSHDGWFTVPNGELLIRC